MNRFWQHPRFVATAQISAYALFFLATLVLALPLTFPTRPLRGLLSRLAAQQGYPLSIEEVRLGMLGGVSLQGVALTLPGKAGEAGENGQPGPSTPEVTLQIDAISARVALLPLLSGKVDVRFDLEAGGGKIEGGRFVRMGDAFDLDIEQIADLSLQGLGVGPRILPAQHMSGALGGELAGKLSVHYGGSTEDLKGAIELDLADALLQAPRLTMQGGLDLADLPLGTVHVKVKMDLRQQVAALAQERGSDKDTVIHIEQLEAAGGQVDLITEETSHIRIPPGKLGWKQAQMQLHFAFSIHDKPKDAKAKADAADEATGDEADAKASKKKAADDANKDRLQWASVLQMAGNKLKPFERGGFIGVTCNGPVARPQCKLDIPRVSVGTRAGAGMRADAPKAAPGSVDGDKAGSDKAGDDRPVEATPPPMEFKPVPRLETPPTPMPTPMEQARPEPTPPPEQPAARPPPADAPPEPAREERPPENERPAPEPKGEEQQDQAEGDEERPRNREEGGEGDAPEAEAEE